MSVAPSAPEGVYGAALLFYLLEWGIALGLLWIWRATFSHLFQGIARALTFTVNTHVGYKKAFHLGGWALTIDHDAQQLFSDTAVGAEILVGKFWHDLADTFWAMSHAISAASDATLDFGHYVIHDYVPNLVWTNLEPLRQKQKNTAAAAAAAAAGLLALRRETREQHHAQAKTNKVAHTRVKHAQDTATDAHNRVGTVEQKQAVQSSVITAVIDVPSLPVPFGRTAKQLSRLAKKHEAIIGATVFAAAMANVLGLPNPRCLTKGPLGRFSRGICGAPNWLLNLLLLGVVETFILSDLCRFTDLMMAEAEQLRPALLELVDVEDALIGCHGAEKPLQWKLPPLSLPPMPEPSVLAA